MDYEEMKRRAALEAVREVEDGMLLGLGTGSTAAYAIREIGRLLREGEIRRIRGVPTSRKTEALAREVGIPLTYEFEEIDLTIDGADEVDPDLNLTKGGGGALLREKIVAKASRRVIIVVDERKLVPRLGTRFPIPVEVLEFGLGSTVKALRGLGCRPRLRGGFRTDNGNLIVDCEFPEGLSNPGETETSMLSIPGVLEVGIFTELADEVVAGTRSGIRRLERTS
ncbi:MAG: ribose-5-phosphate isomerase RpiA [Thermoplasmata archaeon]|nr:ribose-5-phosphate isomerase RpiA [Thermoplasmata archaeon]